jgi:hypothetical protein
MPASMQPRASDTHLPRCSLCGGQMELIASRSARRKILRTFHCLRCGRTDTVAFDRGKEDHAA